MFNHILKFVLVIAAFGAVSALSIQGCVNATAQRDVFANVLTATAQAPTPTPIVITATPPPHPPAPYVGASLEPIDRQQNDLPLWVFGFALLFFAFYLTKRYLDWFSSGNRLTSKSRFSKDTLFKERVRRSKNKSSNTSREKHKPNSKPNVPRKKIDWNKVTPFTGDQSDTSDDSRSLL
jgi:hypothetical protein